MVLCYLFVTELNTLRQAFHHALCQNLNITVKLKWLILYVVSVNIFGRMNAQNSGQFGDHYLNMVYMIVKLIYSLNINSGIYCIMSCLSISADQRLDLNKLGPNDNDTVRGQVVGKKDTHAFLSG